MSESGVDLKILTDVLSPKDAIVETDEPWEFPRLFTEIKSAIESEKTSEEAAATESSTINSNGPGL